MTDLYFIVRDPLYGTITHFYFGNARNAAEKMNELDLCGEIVELDYFDCDHGAFIFVGKENFLFLDHIPKTPKGYNTLVHEIYHATSLVMDFVGVKYKKHQENEARAYYIGFLIEEAAKRL